MIFAYLSHIKIDTSAAQPVYMQLRDAFRELINNGILQANTKLPSSRILSEYFGVHRQTIVAAMGELLAEGWLVSEERKGIFVNNRLPEIKPRSYGIKASIYSNVASFSFHQAHHIPFIENTYRYGFDDGYPDIRLAPYQALGKAYVQTLSESVHKNIASKPVSPMGNILLRNELADMMSTYRGLPISANNILLTHGSQMSIYLVASRLISKGDNVIVTKPSYITANNCFISMGANLLEVGVDENGMDMDDVEAWCKKKKVRCLYVTSHHHHPTTVTLSIERRLRLLHLAERYGFAIIEDDYDYDYHFQNKPLLPIASNDKHGSVIYIGSFSKILSQAFRVGYIIAADDFIQQLSVFRRLVDRHGDPVLEEAIGRLFENNTIKNHIKKAVTIYKERRDNAYALLHRELGNFMHCTLPEGGLAFWAHFDRRIDLDRLSKRCATRGIRFPHRGFYNYDKRKVNACRLGFASMNNRELAKTIEVLQDEIGS
jgi:GntR family transcriptional regulator/MocR family aminotransferase